MLPAALAGVMGAFCIVIFYLALSYGPISIVAPVLASSACIPVIYGLVTGERPSGLQLTGLALTLDRRDPRLDRARLGEPCARPPRHRLRRDRRRAAGVAARRLLARVGGRSVLGAARAARLLAGDRRDLRARAARQRARRAPRRARDRSHRDARHGREPRLLGRDHAAAAGHRGGAQLALPGRDRGARALPSRRASHAPAGGGVGLTIAGVLLVAAG